MSKNLEKTFSKKVTLIKWAKCTRDILRKVCPLCYKACNLHLILYQFKSSLY